MKFKDLDLLKVGNTIQLVGAIYADDEQVLMCMFPEDHGDIAVLDGERPAFVPVRGTRPNYPPTIEVLDMDSDDWTQFLRQTDALETEILTKASDGTLAKAIYRKSQRQIDQVVSWKVFKRDGYACRYCGNDDVPLTVDHLIRWEEGGPTITDNLVSACKKCNRTRGDASYEEWMRHPYYIKASKFLTPETREANEELIGKIRFIKRNTHIRSR